jgi:hypothetical protein
MDNKQIQNYKELITPMIQIIDECIKSNDEDTAYYCLDAFNELAESKVTILDNHFTMIVEYIASANVILNNNLSKSIRETGIDLIFVIASKHRSVFNKNENLLKKTIENLCIMIS